MKILQLHNKYQQLGGEDSVIHIESLLLNAHGQQVDLLEVSNDHIQSIWGKVSAAVGCVYSKSSKQDVQAAVFRYEPDVVHVHNFFPLFTPSIYDACENVGVPVVQTLHNYRLICPGALLMREGRVCEDCITGSPFQAVIHGCYKNSRIGSFFVARMVDDHRRRQTWQKKVARYIALTEFAKQKFIQAEFPSDKIVVKPNFSAITFDEGKELRTGKPYALFVGRLSHEKGVNTLLEAWDDLLLPLHLVGDGPLFNKSKCSGSKSISVLGRLSPADVASQMSEASFLVMPSEWYEGFPMVLVEAFAKGLPVVASRLGSLAEIVQDGITGLHFEAGNPIDLADKVRWMRDNPIERKKMGKNARQIYLERYTPETNYKMLMQIYQDAIDSHA